MTHHPAQTARGTAARALIFLIALVGIGSLQLVTATTARAADYRYWTFWTGGAADTWTFAQKGPADIKAVDKSVEGWRFTISPASGGAPEPRMTPNYTALCPSLKVPTGSVGVAVVIDYGVQGEAPTGETPPAGPIAKCVAVPTGSSDADALAAAVTVRAKSGMVCGINGYPAQECGVAVHNLPAITETPVPGGLPPTTAPVDASGKPSALGKTTTSLSPWPWALGAAAFAAAVIAVSWFFLRMRKNQLSR